MSARILVVDDILANIKLLEAKLNASFYQVLTAQNGPKALEIAAAERPDLVLLDVMMPEMDGFEVCRRMKADPDLRNISGRYGDGARSARGPSGGAGRRGR